MERLLPHTEHVRLRRQLHLDQFRHERRTAESCEPLGNPNAPYASTGSGPNWVHYLTQTFNQSAFYTYNLALIGATVENIQILTGSPNYYTWPLTTQVGSFFANSYINNTAVPWTGTNSLFAIWLGINDCTLLVDEPPPLNVTTLFGPDLSTYVAEMEVLYRYVMSSELLSCPCHLCIPTSAAIVS
ncbi:hypothetical protein MRB53_041894 [Persea americana]|nr:hypothetical protein MRB53_041894 [Persea americana]